MAVDPTKINSVLTKATDEQLMALLKRPDSIPSMFVQQEIRRRNMARQAAKADLAKMNNAQKPQMPPQMTNAIPMNRGGSPIERGKQYLVEMMRQGRTDVVKGMATRNDELGNFARGLLTTSQPPREETGLNLSRKPQFTDYDMTNPRNNFPGSRLNYSIAPMIQDRRMETERSPEFHEAKAREKALREQDAKDKSDFLTALESEGIKSVTEEEDNKDAFLGRGINPYISEEWMNKINPPSGLGDLVEKALYPQQHINDGSNFTPVEKEIPPHVPSDFVQAMHQIHGKGLWDLGEDTEHGSVDSRSGTDAKGTPTDWGIGKFLQKEVFDNPRWSQNLPGLQWSQQDIANAVGGTIAPYIPGTKKNKEIGDAFAKGIDYLTFENLGLDKIMAQTSINNPSVNQSNSQVKLPSEVALTSSQTNEDSPPVLDQEKNTEFVTDTNYEKASDIANASFPKVDIKEDNKPTKKWDQSDRANVDASSFPDMKQTSNNEDQDDIEEEVAKLPGPKGIAGGQMASEMSKLTNAQNQLIEAMKPAGDASDRFWELVANFGARIWASDKPNLMQATGDAMQQTLAEHKELKGERRDQFIAQAKMAVDLEFQRANLGLQLARLGATSGNNAASLAFRREQQQDLQEYRKLQLASDERKVDASDDRVKIDLYKELGNELVEAVNIGDEEGQVRIKSQMSQIKSDLGYPSSSQDGLSLLTEEEMNK